MSVAVTIPTAGESISQVQIGDWRKAEGDRIRRDEVLVELETDKASMELPAPASGTLERILHLAGELVPVGDVIAYIRQDEEEKTQEERIEGPEGRDQGSQGLKDLKQQPDANAKTEESREIEAADDNRSFTAPPERGRPLEVAPRVVPSDEPSRKPAGESDSPAKAGRKAKTHEPNPRPAADRPRNVQGEMRPWPTQEPGSVETTRESREDTGRSRTVPMSMLRRRIAERLVAAQQNAALLTTFNEADLSEVLRARREHGEAFQKAHGVKLGLMSFFVKAVTAALPRTPELNAEIQDGHIVYHDYYDIGVAVSTDQGLVVPVLRDADRMTFPEIERAIADLAGRARERRIALEDLQGGTFTITNGGVFGSMLSTPIVNPPQSAILGLHAIQDRPVARAGAVVIRPMMYLALTYDHRIIDGRSAVSFLREVKESIASPLQLLLSG